MKNLILVRHGESKWNLINKFTGWIDIDLSKNGILESKKCGKLIKKYNIKFNIACTSLLKRSIHTLWNILDETDSQWIKVNKTWRLNERHYGLLQGLNKDKVCKIYGEEKVKLWRRSLKEIPPKINIESNIYYNNREEKYKYLLKEEFPNSESLEMTIKRVKTFWNNFIIKSLKNSTVLIVAHGNSIRSIMQIIHNFNENKIMSLEVPTGIPYIYNFDNNLNLIKNYSL